MGHELVAFWTAFDCAGFGAVWVDGEKVGGQSEQDSRLAFAGEASRAAGEDRRHWGEVMRVPSKEMR